MTTTKTITIVSNTNTAVTITATTTMTAASNRTTITITVFIKLTNISTLNNGYKSVPMLVLEYQSSPTKPANIIQLRCPQTKLSHL